MAQQQTLTPEPEQKGTPAATAEPTPATTNPTAQPAPPAELAIPEPAGRQQGALAALDVDGLDLRTLGAVLHKSGYFKDIASEAQAIVKVLYGRSIGVPPIVAMLNIHVVEGKPVLSAELTATLVKESSDYDYQVTELTDDKCSINFLNRKTGEIIGTSSFSQEDAKKAELQNRGMKMYNKYARNMLFARAMTNGCRWHCPEVTKGFALAGTDDQPMDENEARLNNMRAYFATHSALGLPDHNKLKEPNYAAWSSILNKQISSGGALSAADWFDLGAALEEIKTDKRAVPEAWTSYYKVVNTEAASVAAIDDSNPFTPAQPAAEAASEA